jgi:hypothetical protein
MPTYKYLWPRSPGAHDLCPSGILQLATPKYGLHKRETQNKINYLKLSGGEKKKLAVKDQTECFNMK